MIGIRGTAAAIGSPAPSAAPSLKAARTQISEFAGFHGRRFFWVPSSNQLSHHPGPGSLVHARRGGTGNLVVKCLTCFTSCDEHSRRVSSLLSDQEWATPRESGGMCSDKDFERAFRTYVEADGSSLRLRCVSRCTIPSGFTPGDFQGIKICTYVWPQPPFGTVTTRTNLDFHNFQSNWSFNHPTCRIQSHSPIILARLIADRCCGVYQMIYWSIKTTPKWRTTVLAGTLTLILLATTHSRALLPSTSLSGIFNPLLALNPTL